MNEPIFSEKDISMFQPMIPMWSGRRWIASLILLGAVLPWLFVELQAAEAGDQPPAASPVLPTPFKMSSVQEPQFPNKDFVITAYGAVDGQPATAAIAKAIQACSEQGGGRVILPEGVWKSGAVHMRSNVNLHIEKGATLLFSDDPKDYLPLVLTRWGGVECYNFSPLLYALDCENIAITGQGVIDGNGKKWWAWKESQGEANEKLRKFSLEGVAVTDRRVGIVGGLRPSFIQPYRCRRVLIEGITVKDGPQWTIHPVFCNDVTIRGVKVDASGPNNDGMDIDSCNGVIVERCIVDSGDDGICIKSGRDEDGWRVGQPCENVIVRDCVVKRGHGGIVIGSELSGGVRNIFAHNLVFEDPKAGIRLKSMRGRGGYIRNVFFQNIQMKKVSEAIQVTAFYKTSNWQPATTTPTVFDGIQLRHIRADVARSAGRIEGLDEEPIRNLMMEDVQINAKTGMTVVDAQGIEFSKVEIMVKDGPRIIVQKNVQSKGLPQ